MVDPSIVRVWMGVFNQVVTVSLPTACDRTRSASASERVSFGRAALASASAQCEWPVVAWQDADRPAGLVRLDGGRVAGQGAVDAIPRAEQRRLATGGCERTPPAAPLLA